MINGNENGLRLAVEFDRQVTTCPFKAMIGPLECYVKEAEMLLQMDDSRSKRAIVPGNFISFNSFNKKIYYSNLFYIVWNILEVNRYSYLFLFSVSEIIINSFKHSFHFVLTHDCGGNIIVEVFRLSVRYVW